MDSYDLLIVIFEMYCEFNTSSLSTGSGSIPPVPAFLPSLFEKKKKKVHPSLLLFRSFSWFCSYIPDSTISGIQGRRPLMPQRTHVATNKDSGSAAPLFGHFLPAPLSRVPDQSTHNICTV